jgi:hypothetical protein
VAEDWGAAAPQEGLQEEGPVVVARAGDLERGGGSAAGGEEDRLAEGQERGNEGGEPRKGTVPAEPHLEVRAEHASRGCY